MKRFSDARCALALLGLLLLGGGARAQDAEGRDKAKQDGEAKLEACELGAIPKLHRMGPFYLAGQPSREDFQKAKREAGIRSVLNLRPAVEQDDDEEAMLKKIGLEYHHIPFRAPDSLTEEVFKLACQVIGDRPNHPILVHCASANRVGAVWLVHRVLNDKLTFEQALAEAKTVGLKTAAYEERAREYIEKREASRREAADRLSKLAEEWRYPKFDEDFGGGASGSIRNSVVTFGDTFGDIWTWYAEKCGFDKTYSEKRLYRTVRSEGSTTYLLDDHPLARDGKFSRLRTFFVCSAPDYSVSILLLPGDDDAPPVVYRTITLREAN